MALVFLVMLTTAHLENFDLIVATVRQYRSQHRCTFDQWRTKLNGVARANREYLIESDFGANVCRYLFYFEFFASDNFILLATGFYDRVHVKPHQLIKGLFSLRRAPDSLKRNRENLRLYMDLGFESKSNRVADPHFALNFDDQSPIPGSL